ncbi:uncharacterized protein VP01_4235g1 [Puccinia sorghi]|uniref:SAM domain-containing protein n=1 Tax=Puccinia sorghi TaxID=27349 RepID=A0A0L6UQI2_9BASI|nr:uncharacterized protein VP01_4235g1 [Puccinia sorghi]
MSAPAHPPQPVVGGTGVPSSPPASEGVNLDEYMQFAHVDPTDIIIQRALHDLGITNCSAFHNFKACELEEAGIKKGHARSLISSLNRFERHLKTHQPWAL